jgi:PIN domain nuclease of toxin-antitoxin system
VRILLDTHAFLWWNEANPTLSKRARGVLSNPRNVLVLSVMSAWEMVIKTRAGKLRLPEPPSVYIPTRAAHYGIEILPVSLAHVLAAESLPPHHRDPFDRLLVAQAGVEQIPILSADPQVRQYSVEVVW